MLALEGRSYTYHFWSTESREPARHIWCECSTAGETRASEAVVVLSPTAD